MSKQLRLIRVAAALMGGCLLAGCHSGSTAGAKSTAPAAGTAAAGTAAAGTAAVAGSAAVASTAAAGSAAVAGTAAAGTAAVAGSAAAAQSVAAPSESSGASAAPASLPPVTPSPAAAGAKLNGLPQACPPADEVMSNLKISGLVLEAGDPSLCRYNVNGSPNVQITFNAGPGITPAIFEAGVRAGHTSVVAVPNLGDAAFSYGTSPLALSVLSGGIFLTIISTVPTTPADEISLAKAIIAG
jgi:hypothetical protein